MSNPFYQVLGKSSTAVQTLSLNPGNGSVIVEFNKGGKYLYQGVSQSAIQGALYQLGSLGKFVNQFCKTDGVDAIQLY